MSKKIYFPMLQEKFEERIALPVPDDQEDDEDDEEETAGSVTNAQPSQPPRMEVAPAEASEKDILFLKSLVEDMGSISYIVDCNKHDEITAAISHLPHIIASRPGKVPTTAPPVFKCYVI